MPSSASSDVAGPSPAVWTEWGGSGPQLHFGHANGFPPETYRALFDALRGSFRVCTLAARPLWPDGDPQSLESWRQMADDLRREITGRGLRGGIGGGHSLGSVLSLLAAAEDPSLFRALVLVDPVVFTGTHALFWGTFKALGLGGRLPLIRSAQRRRERFSSLAEVRSSYRGKSVFASWQPQVLDDYVEAGFVDVGDGSVVLRYPKRWEARIFELTPASVWRELRRIEVPILVLRGALSDTFLAAASRRARRELPTATVVEVPGCSHFLPMERPDETARLILDWWGHLDRRARA